jgi:peptidoglycan/LPS O-acetylase OafA/YrhL
MTPERAAGLVTRWVRHYTRRLPAAVAERRIDEIGADLHDHIAYERDRGTGERWIALGVLSRMVRGLAADASWRRRARPSRGDLMKPFAIALALVVVGVLAVLGGGYDDSPGLGMIGFLLILGALVYLVRTLLRRRRSGKSV